MGYEQTEVEVVSHEAYFEAVLFAKTLLRAFLSA